LPQIVCHVLHPLLFRQQIVQVVLLGTISLQIAQVVVRTTLEAIAAHALEDELWAVGAAYVRDLFTTSRTIATLVQTSSIFLQGVLHAKLGLTSTLTAQVVRRIMWGVVVQVVRGILRGQVGVQLAER
jgi:hypothetical protein